MLVIAGLTALVWWRVHDPVRALAVSNEGLDNRTTSPDSIVEKIRIGSIYNTFAPGESGLQETWPRFRGEEYDNTSRSEVALLERFPATGPDIRWSLELGEGHAGAAIWKGSMYLLDYNEIARSDMLRCFDLETGTELWQCGYQVNVKRNHGMSRTVPAVTEEYVVTVGPRAHVMCVNRKDGTFRWGIDIEKEYHSEIPFWYTGQCPLIDNGLAILATGGDALMIAVDCATGEKVWETPIDPGWKMSHASIIPWVFGGRKMYVYSAVGGVCAVAADGEEAGKILWKSTAWNNKVVAPSAVCLPDGMIFLSAGYGAGSMVIQITGSGNSFQVAVVDEYKPVDGLACEQQTPVVWNGHLFAILPKDAGPLRNQFVCVHPRNFREVVWSSGQENRFGLGPYILADEKFYILSDEGVLTIAKPSRSEYIQIDQVKLFDGQDAWAPIAVADGYMVLRDSKKLICINMRRSEN